MGPLDDPIGQGTIFSSMADVHYSRGEYQQAIESQAKWLTIAEQAGIKNGLGIALGSLGNIYESLGDYPKALSYHRRHLAIALETNDTEMEGAALGNIGSCLHSPQERRLYFGRSCFRH